MKNIVKSFVYAHLLGLVLTGSAFGETPEGAAPDFQVLDIEPYYAGSAPRQDQAGAATATVSHPPEHERAAAISNGGAYGVIAPLYLYADPLSLIRLVNGDLTPTTFNITVVGVPSGNNLGTAQIVVPGAATLQRSISEIVTAANATPGPSDLTYSFYIQSAGQLAGYQHIIFSNSSGFLENVSVCKYNLNQSFSAASYAEGV
ncbi:MAG: hypothetical protein LCH56_16180, partial [Proteobacteria bacterium]|nr:hypothetical protein [Pseudomonadota bacterium]